MGISELLWAFRRRWRLIVATLALALAVGWLTTPAHSASSKQPQKKVSYHATEILLPMGGVSLDRLALLATAGGYPNRVRAIFKVKAQANSDAEISGNGVRRVSIGHTAVAVSIDRGGKALRFTATDTDPKRAVQVAQTFAAWLTTAANADSQAQFNTMFKALDDYRARTQDGGAHAQQPAQPRDRGRRTHRRNAHGSAQRRHPAVVRTPRNAS